MNESLIPNARAYASQRQFEILGSLGSGKDGIVLVAKNKTKPSRVAIKVHRFDELYLQEKRVYERLEKLAISTLQGFNVPRLLGSEDGRRVLEMTIVTRPFVLDFRRGTS